MNGGGGRGKVVKRKDVPSISMRDGIRNAIDGWDRNEN
jgi:hypothetical protein